MENDNVFVSTNLLEALKENLSLQRQSLSYEVTTMIDYSSFIDDKTLAIPRKQELNIKDERDNLIVSMLLSENGDEILPSIHTNVPHLIVLFDLDAEEIKTLYSLPIASMFSQFKDGEINRFYVDCYDDVDLAAKLFLEVMQNVVKTSSEVLSQYFTVKVDFEKKQDEQKRLKKKSQRQFASFKAYYKLPLDKKQLEKIETKVTKYNLRAEKQGYSTFNLDKENLILTGSYTPEDKPKKDSFFSRVALAGRNADFEAEFLKVCRLFDKK